MSLQIYEKEDIIEDEEEYQKNDMENTEFNDNCNESDINNNTNNVQKSRTI